MELVVESENGQYELRILNSLVTGEGKPGAKPQAIVCFKMGQHRQRVWETALTNQIGPEDAYISDDGQFFVTVDDWWRGSGPDVLAFYSRKGQIKQYALGHLLLDIAGIDFLLKVAKEGRGFNVPATPEEFKKALLSGDRMRIKDLFCDFGGPFSYHVESGITWRTHEVTLVDNEGKTPTLCMWLKWANGWTAWDMATGAKVSPAQDRVKKWNARARGKALAAAKTRDYTSAIEFLAWLKVPEDRKVIERFLDDASFDSGSCTQRATSPISYFYGYSLARERADQLLCQWDGLPVPEWGDYRFLGVVEGRVKVSHKRQSGDGFLWVYLLPGEKDAPFEATEKAARHTAYLRSEYFPGDEFEVRFLIKGVTPGRYRAAAIWDRVAPPAPDYEWKLPAPGKGDVTSDPSAVFEVKAGQTTRVGVLDCNQVH